MIPPDTDIVILQRPRLPLCDHGILEAHRDKVLIVEIDDHPDYIGVDWLWLRGCHAIQCSTEALAEVCRQYNPNVMVFENQIAELPSGEETTEGRLHTTIFYGAQNRQNDWRLIMPVLNQLTLGRHDLWFTVVHDKEFFDALETAAKSFTPFCEYEKYRRILHKADIALLPLEDTPFNRCKSDLKFLECAAEGVAVLMGSTVYAETLRDISPRGFCYASHEVFGDHLRALIEDASLRDRLTRAAYAYVRDNRLLSHHFGKQYDWYQSLLAAKSDLDRQLLERVPELSAHLAPV